MGQKVERLAWWNIGRGALGREGQAAFERLQKLAFERNVAAKMTIVVEVGPPDSSDPEYGTVSYSVAVKEPPRKSIQHTTALHGGAIISDGANAADALQLEMQFMTPKSGKQQSPILRRPLPGEYPHGGNEYHE